MTNKVKHNMTDAHAWGADLTASLREIKLALYARTTFAKLPILRTVSEALASHIGRGILLYEVLPVEGRTPTPLLNACLRSAFRHFMAKVDSEREKAAPGQKIDAGPLIGAYVQGLMSLTCDLPFVDVSSNDGDTWDVLKESLPTWASRHSNYSIGRTERYQFPYAPAEIGIALLRKILTPEDFLEIAPFMDRSQGQVVDLLVESV